MQLWLSCNWNIIVDLKPNIFFAKLSTLHNWAVIKTVKINNPTQTKRIPTIRFWAILNADDYSFSKKWFFTSTTIKTFQTQTHSVTFNLSILCKKKNLRKPSSIKPPATQSWQGKEFVWLLYCLNCEINTKHSKLHLMDYFGVFLAYLRM